MSQSSKPKDAEAILSIASCHTRSGKEMTDLESRLWVMALQSHGTDAIFEFACYWMSGAGAQKGFAFRSPTIADLDAWVSPTESDHLTAAQSLHQLVSSVGPYESPKASERMLHAIDLLGGWVRVCETMPTKEGAAWAVFLKEFESAWNSSAAQQHQFSLRNQPPPMALGLAHATNLLLISPESVASEPLLESTAPHAA